MHRHSHCSIIPPHVLRQIAQNGTAHQREAALRTLAQDNTFRAMRAQAPPAATVGIATEDALQARKQRSIYDSRNANDLPGTLVRGEGAAATGDPAVDEAYDGLGATFDFFLGCFGRNSIDDEGLPLDASVHYGQDYNNAFWNSQQMVFGDGDGQIFNRFTIALDIIGHELTHGVTEDEAQLVYMFQPGALNESISDVFGSLIKQWVLKQTAGEADWLIGKGLFTASIRGEALRSMRAPGTAYDDPRLGKDPQPGHMKDFVNTYDDNGGVHINSGIPNKAFYLAATTMGDYAWDRAGLIWYEALRHPKLRSNSGFRAFARITLNAADRLYGVGSKEREIVKNAWDEVGIENLP